MMMMAESLKDTKVMLELNKYEILIIKELISKRVELGCSLEYAKELGELDDVLETYI